MTGFSTSKLAGQWQDMGLYWAWRGDGASNSEPPTVKRIEYATITIESKCLNGPDKGEQIKMRLAVTVFDDGVPKEVNRVELGRLMQQGCEITMPTNA
jgi:hypothetical protein